MAGLQLPAGTISRGRLQKLLDIMPDDFDSDTADGTSDDEGDRSGSNLQHFMHSKGLSISNIGIERAEDDRHNEARADGDPIEGPAYEIGAFYDEATVIMPPLADGHGMPLEVVDDSMSDADPPLASGKAFHIWLLAEVKCKTEEKQCEGLLQMRRW